MRTALLTPLLLLIAYLCLWPVPVEPVAWTAPPNPGYVGRFAANERLAAVQRLPMDGLHGPEAIAIAEDGLLHISSHEGWILRHDPITGHSARWVNTGGRPLGLAFDRSGGLLVADAYRGLLRITPDGAIATLTESVDGQPIVYADDVDVAPDGRVFFSDASTKFGARAFGGTYEASLLDLMEHGEHGRLLEYDPTTKTTRVVLSGLSFANGVAVDRSGRFVLVNETGEYRVHRYWLSGAQAGSHDIFIDALPGFPDNVESASDGRFWIGLVSPRSQILDELAGQPFLRAVVARLPSSLSPAAQHYSHVIAVDEDGSVLQSLQDPSGGFHTITGAVETAGWLYLSSLHENSLARIPLDQALARP